MKVDTYAKINIDVFCQTKKIDNLPFNCIYFKVIQLSLLDSHLLLSWLIHNN